MYADRYTPPRVNRGSLGLSVAIVGGLLAAALLAAPVVRHLVPEKPFIAYVAPVTPPPPPEPLPRPQPRVQARTVPAPHVDHPIPQVVTEPKAPYADPPSPPAATDPGASEGPAAGAAVAEPAIPLPPVLTQPGVDERYRRDFQPLYPPEERRAGRDGVVMLKVLVGVDGRVREAVQLMATSDGFWRVTERQALGKWRFKPATRDGIPVEAWRTMTVRFRMADE